MMLRAEMGQKLMLVEIFQEFCSGEKLTAYLVAQSLAALQEDIDRVGAESIINSILCQIARRVSMSPKASSPPRSLVSVPARVHLGAGTSMLTKMPPSTRGHACAEAMSLV